MKKTLLLLFSLALGTQAFADRIYILPGSGFNTCSSDIQSAIQANGHTVNVGSTSSTTLPGGFTSTYVDATSGYDWLLLFGNMDYSGIHNQVATFISNGGKVLYQYEMYSNSTNSNVAALASQVTGLNISLSSTVEIASLNSATQGWRADNVGGCMTLYGNGYRGMDNVPQANRLLATQNLNNSSPSYTTNPAFGFVFTSGDFTNGSGLGALVALGDANIWYEGLGTAQFGGTADADVIDFFFPNASSSCYLLPPGPFGVSIAENDISNQVSLYPVPAEENLTLDLGTLYSDVEVSIINSLGQEVYREQFDNLAKTELSIEGDAGIYFVQIKTAEGQYARIKFVKD